MIAFKMFGFQQKNYRACKQTRGRRNRERLLNECRASSRDDEMLWNQIMAMVVHTVNILEMAVLYIFKWLK